MKTTLTKREQFASQAMAAMAGAIAQRDKQGIISNSPADIAEISVTYADCLIAELAKK